MADPDFNFYYDLTRKVWTDVDGAEVTLPAEFVIRQSASFDVHFTRSGVPVALGTVTAWAFTMKRRDEFSAVNMVYTTAATAVVNVESPWYSFQPDCGGEELVSAMGVKRKVECALQIDYTIVGKLNKTTPLKVDILNDYAQSTWGWDGRTTIGAGVSVIAVTFVTPLPSANWHFLGAPSIINTTVNALGMSFMGLTAKSAAGFTAILSGTTDATGTYAMEWSVRMD